MARALELLKDAPIIDGHNDLASALRQRAENHPDRIRLERDTSNLEFPLATDLARLKAGRVGGQFWSAHVPAELKGPEAVLETLQQIDIISWIIDRYPAELEAARTADDVVRIQKAGKVASLIGIEGGHSMANSFAALRQFSVAGVRYMALVDSKNTDWADSVTDSPAHKGLTPFGERVVREMNRQGILVDLSNAAPATVRKAIAASQSPVIFSHAAARALCDDPRNVSDEVLNLLTINGGLVLVTFEPSLVSEQVRLWQTEREAAEAQARSLFPGEPEKVRSAIGKWSAEHPGPRASLAQVVDHIEHVRKVAGVDHVGLGAGYDGYESPPDGLESGVDAYPRLLAELIRRGWSDEEILKLAGQNLLRVLREDEANSRRILLERSPRMDTISEVDYQIIEPRTDKD